MTDDLALARRVVTCRGWRWLPGMLALEWAAPGMSLTGGRPFRVDDGWHEVGVYAPDLTDAATLGCLLALVREAWGDPGMFVRPRGSKMRPDWAVFTGANSDIVCAALSEAEALVAALEAAPCR